MEILTEAVCRDLMKLTQDEDKQVRYKAISSLIPYAGDPEVLRALLACRSDPYDLVRVCLCLDLVPYADKPGVKELILGYSGDEDNYVRIVSAAVLGSLELGPEGIEALVRLTKDTGEGVGEVAERMLSKKRQAGMALESCEKLSSIVVDCFD